MVTGASGSMGSEVLMAVMAAGKFKGLVILRKKPQNERLKQEPDKRYGSRAEVFFGDLSSIDDCVNVVGKSDYCPDFRTGAKNRSHPGRITGAG